MYTITQINPNGVIINHASIPLKKLSVLDLYDKFTTGFWSCNLNFRGQKTLYFIRKETVDDLILQCIRELKFNNLQITLIKDWEEYWEDYV